MTLDLLAMGRSSIDLYSNDVGSRFEDIQSFAAYVGGCPTNVAVGARRLGLSTALLTGVGQDPVGDFITNFLVKEQVDTRFVMRKPGRRTSAVVLGIEPPDRFPLVYYRDNCADIELTIDDVMDAPLQDCRALLISGTGLSREPSRSATMVAAERARAAGGKVFLDIDFRPDQWHDVRAFGVVIRSMLKWVDVVIGTEDEVLAANLRDPSQVSVTDLQISDARVQGDLDAAVQTLLAGGPEALALKTGERGCTVFPSRGEPIPVPGFPVEIANILGAGDAFASGFIYGTLKELGWYRAGRIGNANGALVVTRHGCANFMGTEQEVLDFIETRGGF